jgi:hypothetical protein
MAKRVQFSSEGGGRFAARQRTGGPRKTGYPKGRLCHCPKAGMSRLASDEEPPRRIRGNDKATRTDRPKGYVAKLNRQQASSEPDDRKEPCEPHGQNASHEEKTFR